MKFLNKKKIARSGWPTTKPPAIENVRKAKEWCQQHPSIGRFYYHYTNTRWWFEYSDDALCFALKWSYL